MKRVDLVDGITLYCADCRDVLPTLGRVDAVVTDPPYGIINKFGVQNKRDSVRTLQFAWDGPHVNEQVLAAVSASGNLAQSFFCFCGSSQISHLESAMMDRFAVKSAVWVKACPPPALPGNWWPSGFEFALFGYRPGAFFNDPSTGRSNVFYTDTYRSSIRAEEKVDHPTQKWLPLMERIVSAMVPENGSCLDLFMGSGSTGVAAVNLRRHFIGIEREPKYFDIACRRISDALSRPDLFITPPPPKTKQEALPI